MQGVDDVHSDLVRGDYVCANRARARMDLDGCHSAVGQSAGKDIIGHGVVGAVNVDRRVIERWLRRPFVKYKKIRSYNNTGDVYSVDINGIHA